MRRETNFDFENRLGRSYWNKIKDGEVERLYGDMNVYWTAELVSSQGAHYHFWISPALEFNKEARDLFLRKCEIAASMVGDPVCFSYDYIPMETK
jgi:hypothetical protein